MKYFKDNKDGVYVLSDGVSPNEHFSEITKSEFDIINAPKPPTTEELTQQAKQKKVADLASVTVKTSSGKVFDGDEVAIARMTAAIIASDFMGVTEAEWKLADNTKATVSVFEVKEALALAIQRVGEIVTA